MLDSTDMTPSTRDLMQFVSPNPSDTETVYFLTETSGHDLSIHEATFAKWEDENICAFIIDTRSSAEISDKIYLKAAVENLECPIIRYQNIQNENDIYDTRVLGFHGLITGVEKLNANDFKELYSGAESVNFRLIPCVQNATDWDIISAALPKFIYLDANLEGEIPEPIKQSKTWFMGESALKDRYSLKCIIETINPPS